MGFGKTKNIMTITSVVASENLRPNLMPGGRAMFRGNEPGREWAAGQAFDPTTLRWVKIAITLFAFIVAVSLLKSPAAAFAADEAPDEGYPRAAAGAEEGFYKAVSVFDEDGELVTVVLAGSAGPLYLNVGNPAALATQSLLSASSSFSHATISMVGYQQRNGTKLTDAAGNDIWGDINNINPSPDDNYYLYNVSFSISGGGTTGGISYALGLQTASGTTWTDTASDGSTAGANQAYNKFKIWLTGNYALAYDIVYQVHGNGDPGTGQDYFNGEVAYSTNDGYVNASIDGIGMELRPRSYRHALYARYQNSDGSWSGWSTVPGYDNSVAYGDMVGSWERARDSVYEYAYSAGYRASYYSNSRYVDVPRRTYTVYFDSRGGSYVSPVTRYAEQVLGVSPAPYREGYTFDGWYTDPNGGSWVNTAGVVVYSDATYYAHWTPIRYNIEYDLAGGTHGSSHPSSALYNETFSVSHPTRAGYKFAGWNLTGMDGVTHTYGSSTTTATSLSGIWATSYKNLRGSAGTVRFTAVWAPITYYIAFNANGGTGSMATMTCRYGTTYSLTANAFKRAGWSFANWNTNRAATGAAYADRQQVRNLTDVDGATVTLYAIWNPTITYVVDGDPNVVTNVDSVPAGGRFTVPSARTAVATRANCHRIDGTPGFDGWYTDSGYSANWVDGTKVSAPLTLYARNKATLRYAHGPESSPEVMYKTSPTGNDYNTIDSMPSTDLSVLAPAAEYWYGTRVALPALKTENGQAVPVRLFYDVADQVFPSTLREVIGWCTDGQCATAPIKSVTVTNDLQLYKPWTTSNRDGVSNNK